MKKFIILITLFAGLSLFADEARVLRYPNSSDTQIAFTHGGDVYVVPITGGLARKVTNSEGIEMYPRFSKDGKTLAFTAEYDGNREIYTMPYEGGIAKRITYSSDISNSLPERMGPDKIIMQWTKDNKILYRGRKESWNVLVGKLYLADTDATLPEELPVPKAGFGYLSPDGTKLVYNRIFREYRTWKRYRGGQADDIWIYDLKTKNLENISNNPAQDIIPMWAGNKIYYISDRTNTLNLYSYDLTTKETKQITNYTDYDVKFPSLGSKHIAFQKGGYIYLMDLATEQVSKVNVEIANDYPDIRPEFVNVKGKITSMDLSPQANKAVFTARGDIFTVPASKGRIYNLTKSSGAHDREATWSPDGKWIAYISDKSGEDEVYIVKPDGSDEIQLTDNADTYRYSLKWSPDSKYLLCSDKMMELYYIDILTKKETKITRSPYWEITDFNWSPDGKWIAFTSYKQTMFPVVNLYSLESGKISEVTSDFFQSYSPVFSKDGKYLFFTSGRTFNGQSSVFEYTVAYNDNNKIYGVTLRNDLPNPFAQYEEDEVIEEGEKDKKDKSDPDYTIETDNIKERIFEVPVEAANYGNMTSTEDGKLYYVKSKKNEKPAFYYYDLNEKEENKVGDFTGYVISHDEKSIAFIAGGNYYIEKLHKNVKPDKGMLNLKDMEVKLDRKAEWAQIFNESWRQMKYFFYDPNMHGLDWNSIKAKYEVMLPHIVHRNDLTYVIGEMIGELNVGHAYVAGGEMPHVERVPVGLLGADFEYSNGAYKITKIYEGRNWDEQTRSPLTEPGLDIKEGDYIFEIDGIKLDENTTPFEALVNKAEKFVSIKYNTKSSETDAKTIDVKTIGNESELRYYNWVEKNRKYVDSVTNGKIGYIHIPDMGFGHGLNEFVKYFYPQIRKEGLIIDDRYNGGGNVSPIIIERLIRKITFVEHIRNQQDVAFTTPNAVFTGPMVCLINEQSMSDGDMFPYQFKRLGLGKLIGKRTWGGIIGIRGSLPLLDGSSLHKPEFANFSVDGDWIIEGKGVQPDIEVDNPPYDEYIGNDKQLDRAIEEVLKDVKNYKGPKLPEVPPYPNKTKAE